MNLHLLSFSPTGTSMKVANGIAKGIGIPNYNTIDVTYSIPTFPKFTSADLILVSVPVYGGHVSPTALQRMDNIHGENTPAVAVVVYGNRHYEQALEELSIFLSERGFCVIGAGTFIGEHSYSTNDTPIAAGRPNMQDMQFAEEFGLKIMKKLSYASKPHAVDVQNIELPRQDTYTMMHFKQTVMEWMKQGVKMPAAPSTNEILCNNCSSCADLCPTSAIDKDNTHITDETLCIKCCACVKNCPTKARFFNTPFAKLLTDNFIEPKENKILL